jgi:hypothetical protein
MSPVVVYVMYLEHLYRQAPVTALTSPHGRSMGHSTGFRGVLSSKSACVNKTASLPAETAIFLPPGRAVLERLSTLETCRLLARLLVGRDPSHALASDASLRTERPRETPESLPEPVLTSRAHGEHGRIPESPCHMAFGATEPAPSVHALQLTAALAGPRRVSRSSHSGHRVS